MFRRRRILRLTPDAYAPAIQLLGNAASRFAPISAVIGIANGGLPPAHDLAEVLRVPTYRVNARHNTTNAVYTTATGHVTHDLAALTEGLGGGHLSGNVLLVDDICGTGATFAAITDALRPHLSTEATVHTVALCRNAGTTLDPDLWVWTVDDWVWFPWEQRPASDTPLEDLITPEHAEAR
jgi:hypothetical protein